MIDNVETALAKACTATGAAISDYTGAPIFMKDNECGAHEWIFEFTKAPADLELFTTIFDTELKSLNSDYEAKRYKNITLREPVVHLASQGLFYRWLAGKGKLGGQNKVPRLSNEREYLEALLELNYN